MSCNWASSIPRLRSMRIACIVWAQELITERTCLLTDILLVILTPSIFNDDTRVMSEIHGGKLNWRLRLGYEMINSTHLARLRCRLLRAEQPMSQCGPIQLRLDACETMAHTEMTHATSDGGYWRWNARYKSSGRGQFFHRCKEWFRRITKLVRGGHVTLTQHRDDNYVTFLRVCCDPPPATAAIATRQPTLGKFRIN